MPIIGLSFHKLVQVQYFQSADSFPLKTEVIADLDQGQILAKVVSGPLEAAPEGAGEVLPVVMRAASEADYEQIRANNELAGQAGAFWKEKVAQRSLDMKLVDVEVYYDRSKIIFYFTSNSRIDFRELVKDLVHEYRVRIEFRQIGVRHETQMTGAVGNCGRMCCCCRYLHQFAPVTIRMAKEQNIFLNPAKVSGICGRLLCCLAYEQESYEKFHSESPRQGKRYSTSRGVFKVVRTNMFYNSVTATDEHNDELKFSLDEWKALSPARIDGQQGGSCEAHGAGADSGEGSGKGSGRGAGPRSAKDNGAARSQGADASRPGQADKKEAKRPTFVTGRLSFRQKKRQERQEARPDARQEARQDARQAQRPAGQDDARTSARAQGSQEARDAARRAGSAQPSPRNGESAGQARMNAQGAPSQAKAPERERSGKNQARQPQAKAGRRMPRPKHEAGENRPHDG